MNAVNQVNYVDLFSEKDRIVRYLRDAGPQPYSRLLMATQLSESVLTTVLGLLEKERKIEHAQSQPKQEETVYVPASGSFFSGIR